MIFFNRAARVSLRTSAAATAVFLLSPGSAGALRIPQPETLAQRSGLEESFTAGRGLSESEEATLQMLREGAQRISRELAELLSVEGPLVMYEDIPRLPSLMWVLGEGEGWWFHVHLQRYIGNGALFKIEPVAGGSAKDYVVTAALLEPKDSSAFLLNAAELLQPDMLRRLLDAATEHLKTSVSLQKGLRVARQRVKKGLRVGRLYRLVEPEVPIQAYFHRVPRSMPEAGAQPYIMSGLVPTPTGLSDRPLILRRADAKPLSEVLAESGLPPVIHWKSFQELEEFRTGDILRHPHRDHAGYFRIEEVRKLRQDGVVWEEVLSLRDLTEPARPLVVLGVVSNMLAGRPDGTGWFRLAPSSAGEPSAGLEETREAIFENLEGYLFYPGARADMFSFVERLREMPKVRTVVMNDLVYSREYWPNFTEDLDQKLRDNEKIQVISSEKLPGQIRRYLLRYREDGHPDLKVEVYLLSGDSREVNMRELIPQLKGEMACLYIRSPSDFYEIERDPDFYVHLLSQLEVGGVLEVKQNGTGPLLFLASEPHFLGLRWLGIGHKTRFYQKVSEVGGERLRELIGLDQAIDTYLTSIAWGQSFRNNFVLIPGNATYAQYHWDALSTRKAVAALKNLPVVLKDQPELLARVEGDLRYLIREGIANGRIPRPIQDWAEGREPSFPDPDPQFVLDIIVKEAVHEGIESGLWVLIEDVPPIVERLTPAHVGIIWRVIQGRPKVLQDLQVQSQEELARKLGVMIPPQSAGLEEVEVGRALDLLAKGTIEDGVVVIGPEAFGAHAGLEELLKRLPPQLAERVILYQVKTAILQSIRAANPWIRMVESGNLDNLVRLLGEIPQAQRVAVLSSLLLAEQLQQALPVEVTLLEGGAALRVILAAAGVSGPVLNQVDVDLLERFFARLQSA